MSAPNKPQFLLFLTPWEPPADFLSSLQSLIPGIQIEHRLIPMHNTSPPASIPASTWAKVTILFTWKTFPPKAWVPNLEYVQLLSAGCNHIMGEELFEETDIAFCTANGVHPPQITEWVFATFLAFQHHLPQHLRDQAERRWVAPESDEDTEDAVGLKVGILGYGAIGRQCARVAKAFGMDVLAYTLRPRETAEERKDDGFNEPGLGDPNGEFPSAWYSGPDQLNDFFSAGLDLLVITVPLTDQTRHMLRTPQFELLSKKKAYISNVARGAVIKTEDLVQALKDGKVRGAALDVTDPEPLDEESELWGMENVIITPHDSGNSNHYNERALKILRYNIERRMKGVEVVNRVDKRLGY